MRNFVKQYEAVIKTMEEKGGFATLGYLYQHAFDHKNCDWKTKTPFASIRRIVQDERFFFKIKPGLWALQSYKNKLPFPHEKTQHHEHETFTHTYYQGLLVEIGNLKNFETFVPHQDKNKKYLEKKLDDITTIKTLYAFTYPHMLRRAQTIDVSWFNERKMPSNVFEVEHTTQIEHSLSKFFELQDFNTEFRIVADEKREQEFKTIIGSSLFIPIQRRVRFLSYQKVAAWHTHTFEMKSIENELGV